jgi:hypothetical protein
MTDRSRRFGHPDNATSPSWGLPLEPGPWGGARYPLDVRPKIPFRGNERWFGAQSYKDRSEPSPGLLSQAFHCLKSGSEALCGAIRRLARRPRVTSAGWR